MRAPVALALVALAGCGAGQTPEDGARATVQRYLTALGRGDAAAACRQFTASSQAKLAAFGGEKLKLPERSCAATVDAALHASNGDQLRRLGRAKIARVEVTGKRADVSIVGVGRRTHLVDGDGGWRIDSEPAGETG